MSEELFDLKIKLVREKLKNKFAESFFIGKKLGWYDSYYEFRKEKDQPVKCKEDYTERSFKDFNTAIQLINNNYNSSFHRNNGFCYCLTCEVKEYLNEAHQILKQMKL